MRKTYDLVIVGGGGSGLATAASAAEHGASVLVLEKEPKVGGATGMSIGSFTASGTRLQEKAGIVDSVGDHEEDTAKFAEADVEARNNRDLRRFFLSHHAETLHWLMSMGVRFYGPSPEPPNRVYRMHNVVPGSQAYISTLQARLLGLGGSILCDAPVTELVKSRPRITGVVANVNGADTEFTAERGVVLAAGYYAPKRMARFQEERFADIDSITPVASGDGHLLAEKAGGKLVNMDIAFGPATSFVAPERKTLPQLLPTSGPIAALVGRLMPLVPRAVIHAVAKRLLVTWQHPQMTLFDDGAILVNANGERFCNEKVAVEREVALASQPDKSGYILLDARLIERYSRWPHAISTAPGIAYAYVADYLKLRPDVAAAAPSLSQIAGKRGLPPDALRATVSAFNRYATEREPDRFGRTGDTYTLEGDSWALLGPARAYFSGSEGSVAISQQFQVLDENDQPIPGLYAVGQNGLGGQILMAHGLHIAWAMTSGRLAGKMLATGQIEDPS